MDLMIVVVALEAVVVVGIVVVAAVVVVGVAVASVVVVEDVVVEVVAKAASSRSSPDCTVAVNPFLATSLSVTMRTVMVVPTL